jgi:hypothetical protein
MLEVPVTDRGPATVRAEEEALPKAEVAETLMLVKTGFATTAMVDVPEMAMLDPWLSREAMDEKVGAPLVPAFKTW